MKASIDIGSNSILLTVGKFQAGEFLEILELARVTGLGRGIDKTSKLSSESMTKTYNVLLDFKRELDRLKVKEVIVTATEASRVAKNSEEFFEKVKIDFGFEVQVLNSYGEAYFAGKGVALDCEDSQNTIIDLGGASTEIIKFNHKPYLFQDFLSFPVGSVRATEWFKEGTFGERFEKLFLGHEKHFAEFRATKVIAIAGSFTTLAAMMLNLSKYDQKLVHNKTFEFEFFDNFVRKLDHMDENSIKGQFPVAADRITTIYLGAKVGQEFFKRLGTHKIQISCYGLRHGLLTVEAIEKKYLAKG